MSEMVRDENKFYGMKYDIVFKKAFVDNNDLLKRFISDMLSIPFDDIGEVVVANPELIPDEKDGKVSRMDIKANINGAIVNIEIQLSYQSYYDKRTVFYWAAIYHGQLERGIDYDKLKKTISLSVMANTVYDHDDYHSVFYLYDIKHEIKMEDVLELHYFELPKIMASPETAEEKLQNMWLETISANSEEEMKAVCQKYNNNYVNRCAEVVTAMNADAVFRERIRAHEDAVRERDSMLNAARQEGKAEAIANIMRKLSFDLTASMDLLNIPKTEYKRYAEIIKRDYPDITIQ